MGIAVGRRVDQAHQPLRPVRNGAGIGVAVLGADIDGRPPRQPPPAEDVVELRLVVVGEEDGVA